MATLGDGFWSFVSKNFIRSAVISNFLFKHKLQRNELGLYDFYLRFILQGICGWSLLFTCFQYYNFVLGGGVFWSIFHGLLNTVGHGIFVWCPSVLALRFGMQEQLSFKVFLWKVLWNLWPGRKRLLGSIRKYLPMSIFSDLM